MSIEGLKSTLHSNLGLRYRVEMMALGKALYKFFIFDFNEDAFIFLIESLTGT